MPFFQNFFSFLSGSGGPQVQSSIVSNTAGTVYTLTRLLGSTSVFSLIAGSDSNLSVSGLTISTTSGIASGVAQTGIVREYEASTNRAVEYPVTLTGAVASVSTSTVFRGLQQGSRALAADYNPSTLRVQSFRRKSYSKVSFRRFRIAIPVFGRFGSTLVDTLFSGKLWFQMGLEYPYVNSLTGLAPRVPVTFSGANYAVYDPSTWNTSVGYILSDIIDLGYTIPADTSFGRHFTVESTAGAANALPYNLNASSYIDRKEGYTSSASASQLAVNGGTDVALTATSYSALPTTQAGALQFLDNMLMLIEVSADTKAVATIGSSSPFGSIEGGAGSSTYGDALGSTLGNRGSTSRGIFEVAGVNEAISLTRASDSAVQWMASDDAAKYSFQLLALANPTHVIDAMGPNDVSGTALFTTRANSTTYNKNDTFIVAGARAYMVMTAGTSGTTSPTATVIGGDSTDGTITVRYLGPATDTNSRSATAVMAPITKLHARVKALLPNASIQMLLVRPSSTSTDNFMTVANQTPQSGYGDATSRRGYVNAYLSSTALRSTFLFDGTIDENPLQEATSNTSVWKADGTTANLFTVDGNHKNSYGHSVCAAAYAGVGG